MYDVTACVESGAARAPRPTAPAAARARRARRRHGRGGGRGAAQHEARASASDGLDHHGLGWAGLPKPPYALQPTLEFWPARGCALWSARPAVDGAEEGQGQGRRPEGGGEGGDPGENPATLLTNYTKFCKQINITANAKLVKTFTDEEALEEFMRVRARARGAPPSLFRLFGAAAAARPLLSPEAELSRARAPPRSRTRS